MNSQMRVNAFCCICSQPLLAHSVAGHLSASVAFLPQTPSLARSELGIDRAGESREQ
jgi:hypothetical protein